MTLESNIHPFENYSGSSRLAKPGFVVLLLVVVSVFALIAAKMQLLGIGVLFGLFLGVVYLYLLFTKPIIGLYTSVALSFILIGMGRYVKDVQVGLGMDAILILTYLALIMNKFRERVNWAPAAKDITFLAFIWLCYSLFEIVNPEAHSMAAWFSGRGVSVYMFLLVPLTLMFINSNRKLDFFLYVWGTFSILASLKGIMQLKFGVDYAEQAWLNEGNYKTHILFGKLRVFSFLSDAGQFGGNQAYTAVVATIYSMAIKNNKPKKLFFVAVAILGFYGMIISGTRGAISIPLAGFMTFFVLRKNIKVLSYGVALLALVFIFFRFTTIGQGNDQIRRMRTAFDPNDASLQVRLDNQKLLKKYLASRPFGGGIGHGGVKAQRYLPNAFLSQVATDSWYVLVWVEQGIVGLLLHLFILFYTVGKASYKVMFKIRDPLLKLKIAALISGMVGVMAASYGNAVLGGMPTGILIYISMAVMLNSEMLDIPKEEIQPNPIKIKN
ncbi:O-antigen ligase family protein [Ferruginibacter sp. SUN106]|uniref:O-antigen ligase family protein n=1 Tax=Ferruginibacter sp. SUN106 TaxID=2978348 RepID=UPI003D36D432